MATTVLQAVVRRFPLVGWSRPSCPALAVRVQEIADIAATAKQQGDRGMAEAAHALNKAALLASDCGLTDLARDLCWQHIDIYRDTGRRLTAAEAGYMLEPVHNLARLQIRADAGEQALHLLNAMHHAVTANTDLTVDGQVLPLAGVAGTRQEHRKLHQWVWLQLLTDGIRALALAGRWDDAVQHAMAHKGIGLHLMEGRQAAIIAHLLNGRVLDAQAMLDEGTPTQPWEQQVTSCLRVMCSNTNDAPASAHVAAMVTHFLDSEPTPGYAVFRSRLGLTVATLASTTTPDTASQVLTQAAEEAIAAGNGYAARDVLRFTHDTMGITHKQREKLSALVARSGIGAGTLPEPLIDSLTNAVETARKALAQSILTPTRTAP